MAHQGDDLRVIELVAAARDLVIKLNDLLGELAQHSIQCELDQHDVSALGSEVSQVTLEVKFSKAL